MAMMTLYARQQKRHRCKEQNFGLCGRRRLGVSGNLWIVVKDVKTLVVYDVE